MNDEPPSQIYEKRLITLSLLNGVNQLFDIGTNVKQGDKFDDLMIKYYNGQTENELYIFSQTIFLNHCENKIITSNLLIGNEQISRFKNDFLLEKYYISYMRIVDQFNGTNKQLIALIFYTNVYQHDNCLKQYSTTKYGLFTTGENTKICKLNQQSSVVQNLYKLKDDLQILVDYLMEFVGFYDEEIVKMLFNNETITYYSYALQVEQILVCDSIENKRMFCKFHENFIQGENISSRALLLREKMLEKFNKTNDEFKIKLRASKWCVCNGFDQKNDVIQLPNYRINEESIGNFCDMLEFHLGQPNGNDLEEEINKTIIKMNYFHYYTSYIRLYLEEFISTKRKENKIFIQNHEKLEIFSKFQQYQNYNDNIFKSLVFDYIFLDNNLDVGRNISIQNKNFDIVEKNDGKLIVYQFFYNVEQDLILKQVNFVYKTVLKQQPLQKIIIYSNKNTFNYQTTNLIDDEYFLSMLEFKFYSINDIILKIDNKLNSLNINNDLIKYQMELFLQSKNQQWIKKVKRIEKINEFSTTISLLKTKQISNELIRYTESIIHKYNINFEDNLKDFDKFLRNKTNYCYIETKETLLTTIKIVKHFGKKRKNIFFVNMNYLRTNIEYILKIFQNCDDFKLIIIDYDFSLSLKQFEQICKKKLKLF